MRLRTCGDAQKSEEFQVLLFFSKTQSYHLLSFLINGHRQCKNYPSLACLRVSDCPFFLLLPAPEFSVDHPLQLGVVLMVKMLMTTTQRRWKNCGLDHRKLTLSAPFFARPSTQTSLEIPKLPTNGVPTSKTANAFFAGGRTQPVLNEAFNFLTMSPHRLTRVGRLFGLLGDKTA